MNRLDDIDPASGYNNWGCLALDYQIIEDQLLVLCEWFDSGYSSAVFSTKDLVNWSKIADYRDDNADARAYSFYADNAENLLYIGTFSGHLLSTVVDYDTNQGQEETEENQGSQGNNNSSNEESIESSGNAKQNKYLLAETGFNIELFILMGLVLSVLSMLFFRLCRSQTQPNCR